MTSESVLIVTRNFPPLTGGMERLMKHTVEGLVEQFDVTLIGPTGSRAHCPEAIRVIECPPAPAWFLLCAMARGLLHCLNHRYRYVIGGSGLVAPITSILARISRARSAVHVHGLDLVVDNASYQKMFVPWIAKNTIVIANSQNTRSIAIEKGCSPAQVAVLNPGVEIPGGDPLDNADLVRQSLELGDNKVVLFVGRIIKRKGLTPFLENAWPTIIAAEPDITLLAVGDSPENALVHDPHEAATLEKLLGRDDYAESVRFLGAVDDDCLWRCYALADVLVFPLIEVAGDIEGFGMVAIEAAACGTPTVAFPIGGVRDAVIDGVNGRLVPEEDYPAFAAAVLELIRAESPMRQRCREHARTFSWAQHDEQLLRILSVDAEA